MDSALIVSGTEKSIAFLTDTLKALPCDTVVAVTTCGEARRRLVERDFDLCLINAPLSDETGEGLSRDISSRGSCSVVLIVKAEHFEEVSAQVEDDGVICVPRPLNRALFWSALKMAGAVHKKLQAMERENSKLQQKIEDIRITQRAKGVLMSYLGMTEEEAHKYIEKQAMDARKSKRAVAEGILKIYEN